jgi:C-terminal processing protease CtpA/Prc
MRRWIFDLRLACALTACLAVPSVAAAQQASTQVPCSVPVLIGDLGVSGTTCTRCAISGKHIVGVPDIEFGTEPVLSTIRKGGPADGKLADQDVLVAVNGQLITTPQGALLYSWLPASTPVKVTVRRAGTLKDFDVVTAPRCKPITPQFQLGQFTTGFPTWGQSAPSTNPNRGWFGIAISCQTCGLMVRSSTWLPFSSYPEISEVTPDSPAEKAGLKAGDLLVAMDGLSLKSVEGANAFRNVKPNQKVLLLVVRDADVLKLTVTLGQPR